VPLANGYVKKSLLVESQQCGIIINEISLILIAGKRQREQGTVPEEPVVKQLLPPDKNPAPSTPPHHRNIKNLY